MVKVPVWEQSVSDLPGASKYPNATPEAFGSQIGEAKAKAGAAIQHGLESLGSGLDTLGTKLTEQYNQQEALKGKDILSDHERAVTEYRTQLERDTPPDQASTIPKMIEDFATKDWNTRRGGVTGKFQNQADSAAHGYRNNLATSTQTQALANKDKYTELQIDGTVEKQNNALMANPAQLDGAIGIVNTSVDETDMNPFQKRQLKLKYAAQLYDSINKGYVERMRNEPLNTALADEAEAFRKNGAGQISKGLNIQDLPPTTPASGGVSQKRVDAIDRLPIGKTVEKVATQTGVDPNLLKVVVHIESSGNPNAVTGSNKGAGQLSNDIFQKYGPRGGDIFNAEHNILATANELKDFAQQFAATHNGRQPTATEIYLMHQQGYAGAGAHLANPDGLAWQNVRKYYNSDAVAKLAIWGNMSKEAKAAAGSVDNVTSRDFIHAQDKWVSGGAGVGDFKRPIPADHMAEADKTLKLTQQERDLYRTHLKNLYGPGGVDNPPNEEAPQESRSTLFVSTFEVDGKHYVLPTVWDGKKHTNDEALERAKKEGLDNYPSYKTQAEAEGRYAAMHEYMSQDTGDYFNAKNGNDKNMVTPPTGGGGGGGGPRTMTTGGVSSRPIVIQGDKGNSFVIPTVSADGTKVLSSSAAVDQFKNTGTHVGVFDQSTAANDYADRITRAEQRAAVPRVADASVAAPLLGGTPKEMQARQDHWDTQFRAVEAYRKQIQDQAKARANADLGQEESAVKAHGAAGVSQVWTPQALQLALGQHDAAVALDKREANLKYNAATTGWNAMTDPLQMVTDVERLNPKNVDPQSPAFKQWADNYDQARALMVKTMEQRDKMVKQLGDEEMKKLIDTARTGVVTTEQIDGAKKWLSHTELQAAYNLRDNPPVQRNDAATIEIENSIKTMPPAEFQKYIMGWVAKNNVGKDELKSYVGRNETYWTQGTQPPITDAKKWLEDNLTPGMTGIEGQMMRGKMADARAELLDWEANPANQQLLKDRGVVMSVAREIYSRYSLEGTQAIRFRAGMSVYFPPGTTSGGVGVKEVTDAKQALANDIKSGKIGDAQATGYWNNLKTWENILAKEAAAAPTATTGNPAAAKKPAPATAPPPPVPPPKTNGYDTNAVVPGVP